MLQVMTLFFAACSFGCQLGCWVASAIELCSRLGGPRGGVASVLGRVGYDVVWFTGIPAYGLPSLVWLLCGVGLYGFGPGLGCCQQPIF
ncbi:hypothetical protein U1Q18_049132, partial [Sarracenia purpurea var. burkii]